MDFIPAESDHFPPYSCRRCKQTLTDLGPLHGHPLRTGEGVADLSGDRSRRVGALPLLHLGKLSMGVLLHTQHTAVLPAATFTAGH